MRYREIVEEKQRNFEEPERRTFDSFKKPLGRTAYGTIDYSKTRLHNPQIIIETNTKTEENGKCILTQLCNAGKKRKGRESKSPWKGKRKKKII